MQSDEELIKRCIEKDRKAQKALYDRYANILLGICNRYAADISEAEDILQDGFVKIFLHLREYSGLGSFFNWMRRIMINTAITYYYRNVKRRYHQDIESLRETSVAEWTYLSDFTRDELLQVIQSLPPGYRMIFNLYAVERYKHREIAELLGIDVNTSKSQYSRAKKLLRYKLEKLSRIAASKKENEEDG